MAKNQVYIDVIVDDKGTTKRVALDAKKLGAAIEETSVATTKAYKTQQGLAQNTSNSTKAFAKQAQGINGFLSLYATWAANVFAVSAAFQFLKDASDITNLIAGQEALTQTTGVAYKTLTENIRSATDGQLSYAEAARAAALGTSSGLSASQLNKLAQGAKNASIVLGRDLTDSFNRLIRGVTKAEPELLDELGIILRLEDAQKRYADSLNLSVKDLTTFEKSQAVANEVLRQTEEKFARIEEVMDPSAASLNRFLVSFDNLINSIKKGTIQELRPVFDALAGNTSALLSGLTLVSYYMVRNLLPNFSQLGKEAATSAEIQQKALAGIRAEAEKTKAEFKQLGLTKNEALAVESKRAAGALSGIDTSGAKKQSGISFLTGVSETAKAAANAEKIIANAEAQTRNGAAVTTGVLKGLTQKQVADLRIAYTQKKLIITDFEMKHTTVLQRLGLQWKVYQKTALAAVASIRASMTALGGFLATWGSRLLAAFGWVGVLYTVGTIAYDIYKSFDPAAKAIQDANNKTDAFITSTKTLNEELGASYKAGQLGLDSLAESVTRIGNAFSSADIVSKIAEFNNLDPQSEKYDEARKELQASLDVLSKFQPEVSKYAQELKNLPEGEKLAPKGLADIAQQAISASTAIASIPTSIEKVNEELRNLTGAGSPLDPTVNIRANLTQLIKELETKQKGMADTAAREASTAQAAELKKVSALEDKLKKARDAQVTAQVILNGYTRDNSNTSSKTREHLEEQVQNQTQIVTETQAQLAAQKEVAEESARTAASKKEELDAVEQLIAYYKELEKNFINASETLKENAKIAAEARERAARGQTLGITTEQQITNLTLEREEAEARRADARNKLILAQARQTEAGGKKEQLAADEAVASAQSELNILESTLNLEERRRALQIERLQYESTILEFKKAQFSQSNVVAGIEQQIADIRSGAAGFVGIEADKKIFELTKLLNEANLALAQAAVVQATSDLDRQIRLNAEGKATAADVQSAREAQGQAIQRVSAVQGDISAQENRTQLIVAEAQAQTQLNRERLAALSINPVEQRFQETLIELGAEADRMSETQLKSLRAEIAAQEELAMQTEMRAGLFESINSNMTSALTGLIDGTKSLKQAFADMAVGILRDLAAMIAKALIFKAIQSAFGFGFADGGVAFGGFEAFANGGMAKGGFRAFANGGMVTSPTLGLVGEGRYNEAIVPLPDGRSIPVTMEGAGQQQNNVVVNVSMDGNGNGKATTSGASSAQAEGLGKAIAAAVQKEIQNQKRAGGMLNAYGAA